MIDTDKYEGHDLSTDKKMSDAIEYIQGSIFDDEDEGRIAEANAQLIADAPLLLAEVKRLRGIIDYIRDTGRMVKPKRYSGFFLSIMEKVLTTEEYFEWR